MTKTDPVEKIKPGRALDMLVAERVMGIPKLEFEAFWGPEHRYSTEMIDAWKVVEKLKKDGHQITLKIHDKPFLYWCEIYRARIPKELWLDPKAKAVHTMKRRRYGEDDFKVWASYVESMPLAICRAALKLSERTGK
jgi:hypothetical protein